MKHLTISLALLDHRNSTLVTFVIAESDTNVPVKELSINAFRDISTRILHRRSLEEGIRKWRAVERILLTKERAAKHLKWARAHQHWTQDDWAEIAWSDECLVRQDSDPRKLWIF